MDQKKEVRIQTSILNGVERKVLIWLAQKIPLQVTSDHLTIIGFLGALLSGLGYILTNFSISYLWLASLGLAINWFGDSLDGTLARVRNAQRPTYGFFIDHNIDGLTVFVISVGVGFSPLISFSLAMVILAGYQLLSIFTYINTYLQGEFKITYSKLGPTEFRLIVVVINFLFMYLPVGNIHLSIIGINTTLFNLIGSFLALALYSIFLAHFYIYLKKYAKSDPPKTT